MEPCFLRITTQKLTLLIPGGSVQCRASQPVVTQVRAVCADAVCLEVCGAQSQGGYDGPPVYCGRQVPVVCCGSQPVGLAHPGLSDITTDPQGHILTGTLDLTREIGQTELVVQLAGEAYLRLHLEVLPTPSCREDHARMREDVNRNLRALALETLRQRDPGFPAPEELAGEGGLEAIRAAARNLMDAADEILGGLENAGAVHLLRRRNALDTAENRLVKYCLRSAARRLARLSTDAPAAVDPLIGELNARAAAEPLARVGAYAAEREQPAAMAPQYQVVYRHWQRLVYLVSLEELSVDDSLQQLPELYRVWCLLQLATLLRERWPMVCQSVVRLSEDAILVHLAAEHSPYLRFQDEPQTGTIYLLLAEYPSAPPDNRPQPVIWLKKTGKRPCGCVFEAVYGARPSGMAGLAELQEAYHRRNELAYENRSAAPGTVFGAFVLYPGTGDGDCRNLSRSYTGGIPLLPGNTASVARLLDKLVSGVPMLDFPAFPWPEELEQRLEQVDWSQRDVLVGALRNPHQLQTCLKRHFYHIPVCRVPKEVHPIHYVAIYQSRKLFGDEAGICYYGEVAEYNAVPRHTIREIPSYSDEPYYRFAIKKWHTLPQPIQLQDAGAVNRMTSLFLLQNSRTDTTLWLENETAYRLHRILQELAERAGREPEAENGFCWGDYLLAVDNGVVLVFYKRRPLCSVSLAEYLRRPAQVLEKLQKVPEDSSQI